MAYDFDLDSNIFDVLDGEDERSLSLWEMFQKGYDQVLDALLKPERVGHRESDFGDATIEINGQIFVRHPFIVHSRESAFEIKGYFWGKEEVLQGQSEKVKISFWSLSLSLKQNLERERKKNTRLS